jgi:lysophospholipase L1-like esterase
VDLKGWTAQLSEYYIRRCDVINRGLSGYTTRHARLIESHAISNEDLSRTSLLTIWFGANDAAVDPPGNQPRISLFKYEEHIKYLVDAVQKRALKLNNQNLNILIMTPIPVNEEKRAAFLSLANNSKTITDRTNQMIQSYTQICLKISQQLNTPCLDLYNLMLGFKDYSIYLQEDGLHLSSEGNQFIFETIKSMIEKDLPHLDPNQLPFIYPLAADF